ncbi:N-6 DNA methylase [Micromonospora zamorensis]|uniref:N-6 DNA methylase n=1 Tax=Micromonospora zamorensis TaxID=709883 RepID=UPI0033BE4B93
MDIAEAGLVSRSDIARLAGVERPAVTNWQRRYADFPRPVETAHGQLFHRSEVAAWLSRRPIPERALRDDELPGTTYGSRMEPGIQVKAPERESAPEGHHRLVREFVGLTADLPRSTTRDGVYWRVVLALVFLRRFSLEAWGYLADSVDRPGLLTSRLADACLDADLAESARVAERLANVQPAVRHAVRRAIDLLNGVTSESSELLGAFDYALERLGDDMSYQFFTPQSVARLVSELVGPVTPGSHCLDPFCRTGELLVELDHVPRVDDSAPIVVRGSHPESTLVELATMNLAMHGIPALMSSSEPAALAVPIRDQFDVVVSNPPFGSMGEPDRVHRRYGPSRRMEFNWLQTIVELLGGKGRGCVVMPNGAAFTLSPREQDIRRALVEDGALAAVVALPTQLFQETSIGVTLWLVQRPSGRSGDVLFIDAQKLGHMSTRTRRQLAPQDIQRVSQEYRRWWLARRENRKFVPHEGFSATAAPAAIAEQGYSLYPPSYVESVSVEVNGDSKADLSTLAEELVRLTNSASEIDADVREMLRGFGGR